MEKEKKEKEINFELFDIERGSKKAEKIMRENEINPTSFIGIEGYSKEEISKNQLYVEKMEKKFSQEEDHEGKLLGKILEAIFYEHAELSEWLGSNVETIKTSRFDDIVNGVDVIAEFTGKEETSHLGVAIDVTLNKTIQEKLIRIKKEIDEGHLAEIEYFYSQELDVRERKKNLPRVIIAADAQTIKELNNLWLEGKNRELGKHKIQYQILREIILQLETFIAYAQQKGNLDHLVKIYQADLGIVQEVYKQKENEDFDENDSMFNLFKSELKRFENLKTE